MVKPQKYIEDRFPLTIWRTDAVFGDMSRTSCDPPIYCKGDGALEQGGNLKRDEYICPVSDSSWVYSYQFGLNNVGRLVLRKGLYGEELWSSGSETSGGVLLKMNEEGNIVLRDKNKKTLWKSSCSSKGNALTMQSGGIIMSDKKGDVSWYIGYDGEESECFPEETPRDRCNKVSPDGNICRVKMIDSLNDFDTILEMKDLGNNKYRVSTIEKDQDPWKVTVEKAHTGALIIDAGVPKLTCNELIDQYKMRDDDQLTFKSHGNKECKVFAKNLMYFMVEEWFYFG